jgi:GNAT superfamily N-acetyltransferase
LPPVTDPSLIRRILERDRPWAAYALGDLSPGFAEHCQWFATEDGSPALLLLFRRFDPPVLLALGPPRGLEGLIREIDAPVVSLHVRTDALAAVRTRFRPAETRAMWRMVVEPGGFRPVASGEVSPLAASDIGALTSLYADGHRRNEGPDFFDQWMVEQGIFRGVWEAGELVSVAGTHLVVPSEGVCAVGNVYTRHDRRRQGLGARVTSAVVSTALAQGIPTVILNVARSNAVAIRAYQRLGFRSHCDFVEGLAFRS